MRKPKKELESKIEGRVTAAAKRLNIFQTKNNLMGFRGMPDRTYWLQGGKPLLIEYKRLGEKPTELQKHRIDMLRALGYWVEVFDSSEAAIKLLTMIVFWGPGNASAAAKGGMLHGIY